MEKSVSNQGFIRALVDCGMLSKTDKRVKKLNEVDMTKEILYFSKLGINLESVIDLVYELDRYNEKLRERFLKDLDKALKTYKRYMINYDTNKLIREITEDLKNGVSLNEISFKLKSPKENNCILRINGDYYRVKRDKEKVILINEANNRLYMEGETLIIINDKLKKVETLEKIGNENYELAISYGRR